MALNLFRAALLAAWIVIMVVTIKAGQALGFGKAGDFFFGDMSHPWRAQFNTDFGFHLLLVATWLVWSARNWALGVVFAVLAIMGGCAFTLPYILIQTFLKNGNIKAVVLGRHSAA
jgi:hypothetical protein